MRLGFGDYLLGFLSIWLLCLFAYICMYGYHLVPNVVSVSSTVPMVTSYNGSAGRPGTSVKPSEIKCAAVKFDEFGFITMPTIECKNKVSALKVQHKIAWTELQKKATLKQNYEMADREEQLKQRGELRKYEAASIAIEKSKHNAYRCVYDDITCLLREIKTSPLLNKTTRKKWSKVLRETLEKINTRKDDYDKDLMADKTNPKHMALFLEAELNKLNFRQVLQGYEKFNETGNFPTTESDSPPSVGTENQEPRRARSTTTVSPLPRSTTIRTAAPVSKATERVTRPEITEVPPTCAAVFDYCDEKLNALQTTEKETWNTLQNGPGSQDSQDSKFDEIERSKNAAYRCVFDEVNCVRNEILQLGSDHEVIRNAWLQKLNDILSAINNDNKDTYMGRDNNPRLFAEYLTNTLNDGGFPEVVQEYVNHSSRTKTLEAEDSYEGYNFKCRIDGNEKAFSELADPDIAYVRNIPILSDCILQQLRNIYHACSGQECDFVIEKINSLNVLQRSQSNFTIDNLANWWREFEEKMAEEHSNLWVMLQSGEFDPYVFEYNFYCPTDEEDEPISDLLNDHATKTGLTKLEHYIAYGCITSQLQKIAVRWKDINEDVSRFVQSEINDLTEQWNEWTNTISGYVGNPHNLAKWFKEFEEEMAKNYSNIWEKIISED